MRRILLVGLLLGVAGCIDRPVTPGWRVEVLKPPTLRGETLINEGPALLDLVRRERGFTGPDVQALLAALGSFPTPGPAFVPRTPVALAPPCTLEEVCRRLDALEALLRAPPPPIRGAPPKQPPEK